jgi:MacB-like periplasmic core domain
MPERIYRFLLLAYPKWFRKSHADELLSVFRDCHRECRETGGTRNVLYFWLATIWDAVSNGGIMRLGAEGRKHRDEAHLRSRSPWTSGWVKDFRYALRQLPRSPGFSVAVILTLGLGIGANTALFGVIQAVLLRPLPFNEADRIVILGEFTPAVDTQFVSPVTFADWSDRQEVFQQLAAHRHWQNVNLEDDFGEPEPIDLVTPTANFFEVMGVRPFVGRFFKEEQNPRGGSEAVLNYDFWQRRYGGRRDILGKAIRIRGTLATVVGIMPPASANLALGWGDVWTCLYRYNLEEQRATSYQARYLTVIGRLMSGI